MAYLKYKELTQYFNFFEEITEELPNYVTDYLIKGETIIGSYKTYRDKGVFTTHRIILFDQKGLFGKTKQITTIPYLSLSSLSISFNTNSAIILLYLDSGYPVKLKFVKISSDAKTKLRQIYQKISIALINKK